MNACRTIEMREAPMHLAADWVQIGVTRGLLLGMLYPWLAGAVLGMSGGMDEAIGAALAFGLFGTLIGLLAGPLMGGAVGGVALVLDRHVSPGASSRSIGALAILVVAGALSTLTTIVTYATGNSLGETWGGLTFLVLAPSALGLASLAVRPGVDRPRAIS